MYQMLYLEKADTKKIKQHNRAKKIPHVVFHNHMWSHMNTRVFMQSWITIMRNLCEGYFTRIHRNVRFIRYLPYKVRDRIFATIFKIHDKLDVNRPNTFLVVVLWLYFVSSVKRQKAQF